MALALGIALYAGFALGTWHIIREPHEGRTALVVTVAMAALWPLTLLAAIAAITTEGL